jgi:hypothetical protein
MTNHNVARNARQALSLNVAANRGQGWDQLDVDLVATWQGPITLQLAEELGRTEFALQNVRQLLRSGQKVGSDRQVAKPVVTCSCHGLQVLPAGDCVWA